MNKYRLQLLAAVAMTIVFFALLGWAGDCDYTEQVILRMSYEEYDYVKDTLTKLKNGTRPSEREIAHWWEQHHEELR
jgi:hypothetical protein